jgi:tRNA (guanine26-N2/guanine27-N2)-dimethyltransferase
MGIHVPFCHSTAHYVRVYVEVGYGAKKADDGMKNLGFILHCFNCLHRENTASLLGKSAECPECNSQMDYAGPLWLGNILEKPFCEAMADENTHRPFRNSATISKLLSLTIGEAEAPPTYYVLDKLSAKLTLPAPPVAKILARLRENGCSAVPTHFNSRGIRTNASAHVMRELLRKT